MPTIIGFEIKVENIDTIFKLSQDKDEISYENIIDKLEKRRETTRSLQSR